MLKYFNISNDGDVLVPVNGAYAILLFLSESKHIRVGQLGDFNFPKGYYIYTGRASRGLKARLNRHLTKDKSLRWHIDYLTSNQAITIQDILVYPNAAEGECLINQAWQKQLERFSIAPGFGASDCLNGCGSHLVYSKKKPEFHLHEI